MSTSSSDNGTSSVNPYKAPVSAPSGLARRFFTLLICFGLVVGAVLGGFWIYGRSTRSSDELNREALEDKEEPRVMIMRSPAGGRRTERNQRPVERSHSDSDDPFAPSDSIEASEFDSGAVSENPFGS